MVTAPTPQAAFKDLISNARRAQVDPRSLLANPHNYRAHPQSQRDAMTGILSEVGWVAAVIVSERSNLILNGHLRVAIAIEHNEPTVPVDFIPDLTPQMEDLILLSFDMITGYAENDPGKVEELLGLIQTSNLQVLQLLEMVKRDYLPPAPRQIPDDPGARFEAMDQLVEELGMARGQVWFVGPHRVACGDCTDPGDVAALFGGGKPNLMVTDPPYGVDYDPSWRLEAVKKGLLSMPPKRLGKVTADDRADWRQAWALFPGDVAYTWHGGLASALTQLALEAEGFVIRAQIVWLKNYAAISRGAYHWQHEPCWYAVRKGASASWQGGRKEHTVWEIPVLGRQRKGEDETTVHGTQKPVECMARPIRNHAGDVYDPFLGSGTTAVAAAQEGRGSYGMEIDPGYAAVAVDRLRRMLGEEPRKL